MNKLAIIQARMSSSRLPGKVMQDISGKPMLQHVAERARQSRMVDQVVLATTTDPSDDILEQFSQKIKLACYRGSLPDVLDRYYQAAVRFQADIIIRLTADCPLLDADILDRTVITCLGYPFPESKQIQIRAMDEPPRNHPFDFYASRLPPPWKRTLPIGLDVEVCPSASLERAWREADKPYQREHVMPYLYEEVKFSEKISDTQGEWTFQQGTTPRGFKVGVIGHSPDYGALRWTVDTPADLEFVRQVYDHFRGKGYFGWQSVLDLLEEQPELAAINADVQHKTAFDVDHRNPPVE